MSRAPVAAIERTWLSLRSRIHVRRLRPSQPLGTVVMIPGLGVSGRYLLPTANLLAQRFDVIVPDLPGTGRSGEAPAQPASVESMVDSLVELLDALDVERAHLVGNSLGCQVAVELAVRRPEHVLSVTLTGVPFAPHERRPWLQLRRFFPTVLREPVGLWLVATSDYLIAGLFKTWRTFRAVLRHRLEDRLPALRAPLLVIRGAQDRVSPPEWNRDVASLGRGTFLELPDALHGIPYDSPQALTEAICRFIDSA